jgi:hypothetical protein
MEPVMEPSDREASPSGPKKTTLQLRGGFRPQQLSPGTALIDQRPPPPSLPEFESGWLDLTGQLSNLPLPLQRLLAVA